MYVYIVCVQGEKDSALHCLEKGITHQFTSLTPAQVTATLDSEEKKQVYAQVTRNFVNIDKYMMMKVVVIVV